MKILIIDECFYTRSGVNTYLNSVSSIKLMDVPTVEEATLAIQEFQPDIIIVNLTQYCRYGGHCPLLAQFIHYCTRAKVYIYLDASYPFSETPIPLTESVSILAKKHLPNLLRRLPGFSLERLGIQPNQQASLFSPQEHKVMCYWMTEMPNYRIARKLNISGSTVYSHKRHITEKIKVRNRLELCFIYNVFKYLY
ncbi:bacterial regulatory s, luxR family protein [Yersinia pseudotuberculosis IP 32953]|uniref:LuxR family transcriptional regulator n=4 Tax=Yersinia pseudotuberculosis TaxID=633 RepID=A0ABM7AJT4_YERPU|nr:MULTISPECIES: LuxR family transcriptional regulator [Yersinia pseudotuberculosis complex]ABS46215.1 transcriptional regulator, LuxR family [Yersinia pseudotuberculosis IP 31758]AIN15344.1 bacterial regulatory s, luxR family protein [Yersinia pseudotuberculosis]AJJ08939.1 bacterial regulatory s, luxR family protein [Yersinia pseudotuberculosis]AJJ54471.1 bacterial regulatory s, luxR family protein [Yersinia pseudotuberculosis IP 32953]AJJ59119.1 bacterial regulatory s, luxR family protein [Y